jgi:hypothetical protein
MEYLRAVLTTELSWVQSIISDLDTGRLTWGEAWLRQIATQVENSHKGDKNHVS